MNMNKGKLSIIVPIYNTSNYLRKCLDSVLEQTYKNLEIILVNACSTDNSQEIIDEYCKKDDLVGIRGRIESKENNPIKIIAEKVTFLSNNRNLINQN